MKRCKKLLCLVLALVMALSLCTVAMAAETGVLTEEQTVNKIAFKMKSGVFEYGELPVVTVPGAGLGASASDLAIDKVNEAALDGSKFVNGAVGITSATIVDSYEGTPAGTTDSVLRANKQYYLQVVVYVNGQGTVDAYPAKFAESITTGDFQLNIVDDSTAYTPVSISTVTTNETTKVGSVTVYFELPKLTAITDYSAAPIPFTKVVKLGGNTEPGAQTFTLEQANVVSVVFPNDNDSNETTPEVTVSGSVNTNGAGTYTDGKLTVTGDKIAVNAFLKEGFYVKEVDVNKEGWDCDDQVWFVKYVNTTTNDGDAVYAFRFWKATETANGCTYDADGEYFTAMTFTNTYTENTTHEHTRRQPSTPTTPEAPVASPKTGDMGVALYAAMAVLSMSGSAVILGKKRSK